MLKEIPYTSELFDFELDFDLRGKLKWAGSHEPANEDACDPFPKGFFATSLALVRYGACDQDVKLKNAETAGAIGIIFYDEEEVPQIGRSDPDRTPMTFTVMEPWGQQMADWCAAHPDDTRLLIRKSYSFE